MRTKKSWMLPASEKAALAAFFSRLLTLVCAYGRPPDSGGPDDDQFWSALVESVGRIGAISAADDNPLIAKFLLALLEGLGDKQRQAIGGAPERSA